MMIYIEPNPSAKRLSDTSNTINVGVRLKPETLEQLDQIAERERVSRSAILRAAMNHFIDSAA